MRKFTQARDLLAAGGWFSAASGRGDNYDTHHDDDGGSANTSAGPGAGEELVEPCAEEHLRRVHTADYLRQVREGALPPNELRRLGLPAGAALLERCARETEGTRRACWAALENGNGGGLAINLAGGTHHAFPDRGEGFCVLNDVAVAIRNLQRVYPKVRVFIADTDAHQGNGTHAIFAEERAVFTYSIHVGRNYPSRKVPGDLDVPLERWVEGDIFLESLKGTLPGALEAFQPDLIIWLSGADPHRNDRFGQMRLSVAQMAERDTLVCGWALERGVPLVVLYGGGYNRERPHTARIHRNTVVTALRMYGVRPAGPVRGGLDID